MKDDIYKTVKNFSVIIHPDESGGFWVECPSIQGCYSEGNTIQEAEKNIQEAIELCLEVQEEENQPQNSSRINSYLESLPI